MQQKRAEAQRANPAAEPGITAGNGKKAARMTQRHAANRDMNRNIRNDHQLVAFEPHWPTWKTCLVDSSNQVGPFFTCPKCWRFGHYRIFGAKCKPMKFACDRTYWMTSIKNCLLTLGTLHLKLQINISKLQTASPLIKNIAWPLPKKHDWCSRESNPTQVRAKVKEMQNSQSDSAR